MLDHVGGSKAVSMPLPSHIADHQAAAIRRPVAVHQLDVVCPTGVHVRPGVLSGETASHTNVCQASGTAHMHSVIADPAGGAQDQGNIHLPLHICNGKREYNFSVS